MQRNSSEATKKEKIKPIKQWWSIWELHTEDKSHAEHFNNVLKKEVNPNAKEELINYRKNIVAAADEHRRLDLRTEGATVGMNNFPSEEEIDKHKIQLKELNESKEGLRKFNL